MHAYAVPVNYTLSFDCGLSELSRIKSNLVVEKHHIVATEKVRYFFVCFAIVLSLALVEVDV